MADKDSKRYYWLKLNKDFFQQHQIKVLKALPNGRLYALIYLELLAESTSHDGELRFSKLIPYDTVTLAAVIDEDKDNLEKAIEILEQLELVEILEDKTIFMSEIQKMIGSETGQTKRKRESKLVKITTSLPNDYQKNTLEYRDKSIEIRDKNNNISTKHKYGEYKHVLLTNEEYEKLLDYPNREQLITFLDEYIEMKGYKAKSHYLAIKKWVVDAVSKQNTTFVKQNIQVVDPPKYDTSKNNDLSKEELEQLLNMRGNYENKN